MKIGAARAFCCALIVFTLAPALLFSQSVDSASDAESPGFTQKQSPPPDEAHYARVINSLAASSISYERRPLLADYGGFSSSIIVRSAGETSDSELPEGAFVFAVPLYADFAVDTALALVKKSAEIPHRFNLIIAFLGDQLNELPDDLGGIPQKGLQDLLTLVDLPENWILCYFNADEAPSKLMILHGKRGYVTPLDIIKPLPYLFSLQNIPWSFLVRYNEIYKLGLVEGADELNFTWAEEINSFVISGAPSPGTTDQQKISTDVLSDLFLDYSNALSFPVFNADMHYTIIRLPGNSFFFLSERFTVSLLIICAALSLFLFLLFTIRYYASMIFRLKLFFRSSWIFIILIPLLALCLKAAGFLYSLLFNIFSAPNINNADIFSNYFGMTLIVLLAAFIFYLPSPFLNLFYFPRRAQFYGFTSVIFIALGIFLSAFMDLSYVPIFLWAFIFIFIGASISSPVIIYICAILIPVFAIDALINIFETGSIKIAGLFISPFLNTMDSWSAALQLAFFSLPIFLLFKRGSILSKKSLSPGMELKPDRKKRILFLFVLIACVIGSMIIQISLIPTIKTTSERRYISTDSLNLSLDDTIFQDTRIITLNLEAKGNPVRFDVSLENENRWALLPVYSAPVPYFREDDGRRIYFSLGEYPPNPLALEIVVPANFTGELSATALYNTWDSEVDPGEKPDTDDYVLFIGKRLKL